MCPLHLNLPLRSPMNVWSARSVRCAKRSNPSPLTLALSPNPRNGLGEREDIVGTLTQGGARGSCLALALGYSPPPRWGSTLKKRPPAASQMSNLQPAVNGWPVLKDKKARERAFLNRLSPNATLHLAAIHRTSRND